MDKIKANKILDDIKLFQKEIENKYGITIKLSGLTCSEDTFNCRLSCVETQDGETIEASDFRKYAVSYGLKAEDLYSKFTSNGKIFTIVGLKKSGRKKTIIIKDEAGDQFITNHEMVAEILKKERGE